MALAKRSRGGLSGWFAAAMLALAVYAAQTTPAAVDESSEPSVTVLEPAAADR